MNTLRLARGGETAFSPERTYESPAAAAKEGACGGTLGSPTPKLCRCTGYDPIVESIQAAARAGA